jgi:hypothetical protein
VEIKRQRWVITRNNGTEIFCGLARAYQFKPINNIGDTSIKTYLSRNKAIASFESSWDEYSESLYMAVEVIESITEVTE